MYVDRIEIFSYFILSRYKLGDKLYGPIPGVRTISLSTEQI